MQRGVAEGVDFSIGRWEGMGVEWGMEFDLMGDAVEHAYGWLTALVAPRPIAWVTTLNEDGSVNAAPFSFYNLVGDDPPLVVFSPGDRPDGTPKDTARNVERSGEFVIHVVDWACREAMNQTAASWPSGVSEVERGGLRVLSSRVVKVPRLEGVPAAMECEVCRVERIGGNRVVFGWVKYLHVADEWFDEVENRVREEDLDLLGRLGPVGGYCRTRDRFAMPRPRLE